MTIEIAGQAYPAIYFIMLGTGLGFTSGLLGIGGGFILSPLLLMLHMPLNQVLALSAAFVATNTASLYVLHYRKNQVDHKLGGAILGFALLGIITAIGITKVWGENPQLKTLIMLAYAVILMFLASQIIKGFWKPSQKKIQSYDLDNHGIYFPQSQQHIRLTLLIPLSLVLGFLSSILGIGSGLIFIPSALYLIHMQEKWVMGTNALIMLGLTSISAGMQAWINQSLDWHLWGLLSLPAITASFIGTYTAKKIQTKYLRLILAVLMIGIAIKMLAKSLF